MIHKLAGMIRSARYCVAFTGAGVSSLSGLPCFRDGAGETFLPGEIQEEIERMIRGFFGPSADPSWEELFSAGFFEREPSLFYEKTADFLYHDREPSLVHRVLAGLERAGLVKAVVTQNIDGLHQKAGSRRVIELHGSPAFHYCLRCAGIRLPFEKAAAVVRAGGVPLCPECRRPLKPAVTLYGELLPMEARREAEDEAQKADLMLVLGTSLRVFPAADLPKTVLRRGGRIAIVNRQDTVLDGNAAARFRDLEEVFLSPEFFPGCR